MTDDSDPMSANRSDKPRNVDRVSRVLCSVSKAAGPPALPRYFFGRLKTKAL